MSILGVDPYISFVVAVNDSPFLIMFILRTIRTTLRPLNRHFRNQVSSKFSSERLGLGLVQCILQLGPGYAERMTRW